MGETADTCDFTVRSDFNWRCHRTCEPGFNRCIFHRPRNSKPSDEVRDEFIREIENQSGEDGVNEQRQQKQFIGIKIDTLDLRNVKIDAPDTQPLDLRHASIGELLWEQAEFQHSVRLDNATIEDEANLSGAAFGSDLTASSLTVQGTLTVENSHISDTLDLTDGTIGDFQGSELSVGHDLILDDAVLGDGTTPTRRSSPSSGGPTFEGGGMGVTRGETNSGSNGEINLEGCNIGNALTAVGTDCWGPFIIEEGTAVERCILDDIDLHSHDLDLTLFETTTLSIKRGETGGLNLSHSTLQGSVKLDDFESTVIEIEDTYIERKLKLRNNSCESLRLKDSFIEGDVILKDSTVSNSIELQRIEVSNNLDLSDLTTQPHSKVQLDRARIRGQLKLVDAEIMGRLSLTQATVLDDIRAKSLTVQILKTLDANFGGDLDLSDGTILRAANLKYGTFEKQLKLKNTSFQNGLQAHHIDCRDLQLRNCTVTNNTQVLSFKHSKLASGDIRQHRNEGIIDVQSATIGRVKLHPVDDELAATVDSLKFCETAFDGFNFSQHSEILQAADWQLHEKSEILPNRVIPNPSTVPHRILSILLAPLFYILWLCHMALKLGKQEEVNPADVVRQLQIRETTYQLAKNGAGSIGDAKISGQLFIQESSYRHLRLGVQIITDRSLLDRIQAIKSWLSLSALQVTSLYGERASWVLWNAGFVIITFAGIFRYANIVGTPITNWPRAFSLSLGSFVTLAFGASNVNSELGRLIAQTEGFIGAFLIAVFVFALTRSVHR